MPGDPLERELRAAHQKEAQDYLDGIVGRLRAAGAESICSDVLEERDSVSQSIREDVARTGADLVVLTSHGRGTLQRVWLGSVADKLVRTLPVPVLMVRPQEPASPLDFRQERVVRHMLLALDGTTEAESILAPAVNVGQAMGSDYTLVRVLRPAWPVLHPTWHGGAQVDEKQQHNAVVYLESVAERLRAERAKVHTHVSFADQPAAAILEHAARSGADLIALETHGRGGVPRLLMGSVADKVVRGSSIPVLICRYGH
jgi:nucleotide-binding universal stress UspA family protein